MIPPKKLIPLLLAAAGLIASVAAIFATTLGLDQNADWSRARIGLLLFGSTLILCAALYYKYIDQIHSAIHFVQIVFGDIPQWIITGFTVAIVIIIYVWFASSGRWTIWKSDTYYYDRLARGFLGGHLYLPIEPAPNLLGLFNPYNPMARKEALVKGVSDLSFYQGKLYLYWGPVPALILAAIYQAPHEKEVGDLIVAFSFVCGIFLIQTALTHFLWRQYFIDLPQWTLHISTLIIGLVGPLILLRHVSGSARIYEAAISGAQFFFMAGVLTVVPLITGYSSSNWRLIFAGTFWALAIGTRLTTAAPIFFMTVLLAFWIFKLNISFSKKMTGLIFLGAPLFLGFLCQGWYNWARFDSVVENGFYYQLSSLDIQNNTDKMFSMSSIFQNIYNYIFIPPAYLLEFPFVFIRRGTETPFFAFYSLPAIYRTEWMAGLLYTSPFIIFSLVPLLMFAVNHFNNAPANSQKLLTLVAFGLGASFMASFSLLMMYFWAGMRFTGDFMPSLIMLSIIGFWQGYQTFPYKSPAGKFYTTLAVILAGLSILAGILVIISTDTGLIKKII